MSKRLVLSDREDNVDNLKTKKRFTITESDDDDDDNPSYDVVEFNETRSKLRLCRYDETKATEITISIYSRQKLALNTPSPAINITVSSQSTAAERTVSFDEDAFPVAAAPAASAAYSAAVATATETEESSENDDIHSHSAFIVVGECSGDGDENTVKLTGKSNFFKSNSDRRQLYLNAEWLSCFVQQEHDPGVLTAYVLLFYTFLSGTSITSHVGGLINVTHVDKLLLVKDFVTQFLGGFLPGWLNLIFDPNFGRKSFTTAVLDSLVRESKKVLKMFDNKRGSNYMKATHRQKWW
jgi:hypothetical protein